MAMQDLKYDAFISYRHTELDQFVAQNLHRELEKFRLPKQLVKEQKLTKTKVERVFRDKEELTLVNDLKNPLYNALVNSEYLIVICTPRLKDSEWCKREIDTFIELHGKERILLVLAEGEPEQSFPEQLMFEEVEEKDENGTVRTVKKMVEPLAADVRGKNKAEIKKKIKAETLRITASMFQVNYDEVKQRHKEQKIKKTATISLICSGIFLCVGAYSISTALQLRSQARKIEEQNAEIRELADDLDEQYNKVQASYAKSLTEVAAQLFENGQRMEALYLARKVLSMEAEEDVEYLSDARKVLSDALYIYEDGEKYVPIMNYMMDTRASKFLLSDDQTKMIVFDQFNRMTIWNLVTNENVYQSAAGIDVGSYGLSGEHIYYSTSEGVFDFNLNTYQNKLICEDGKFLCCSRDGKYYAYKTTDMYGKSTVHCVTIKDEKEIWTYYVDGITSFFRSATSGFSADGRTLFYAGENENEFKIYLIDVQTGNMVKETAVSISDTLITADIKAVKDGFCFYYTDSNFGVGAGNSVTRAICFDDITLDKKWEFEKEGYFSDFKYFECQDKEYLAGVNYDKLAVYDAINGTELHTESFDEGIVRNFNVLKDGYIVGFKRNGEMYLVSLTDWEYRKLDLFSAGANGSCEDFIMLSGALYYLPSNSRNVVYYEMKGGRRQEILVTDKTYDIDRKENRSGTLSYKVENKRLTMYDNDTMSELFTVDIDVKNDWNVSFVDNGEDYFVAWKDGDKNVEWTIYSSRDGSKKDHFIINDNGDSNSRGTNNNGTLMLCSVAEKIDSTGEYVNRKRAYDVMTGKFLAETPISGTGERCDTVFADNMSVLASVDRMTETVSLYRIGEEVPYAQRKIPGVSAGACILSTDGRFFACSDCYSKIILYETENLDFITEYDDTNLSEIFFERIEELDVYALRSYNITYFVNDNGRAVASMKGFRSYDSKRQLLIQSKTYNVYGYPFYTLDMLLEEADDVLKDYELPINIKEKYGLE